MILSGLMIRMDKVINAARENNIAIEINNRYRIPSFEFLKRAKKAGVKFTVGTNNKDENFSGAEYAREIISKLNLKQQDFYQPVNKRTRWKELISCVPSSFFPESLLDLPFMSSVMRILPANAEIPPPVTRAD